MEWNGRWVKGVWFWLFLLFLLLSFSYLFVFFVFLLARWHFLFSFSFSCERVCVRACLSVRSVFFRCFSLVFFFSSNQCGRAVKNKTQSADKTQCLNKLSTILTIINGHTTHPQQIYWSHETLSLQWRKTGSWSYTHFKARSWLLPFPFLCLESTTVLSFQAFTSRKKKKKNQCGAGPIAMYLCLFFFQMRKINASG